MASPALAGRSEDPRRVSRVDARHEATHGGEGGAKGAERDLWRCRAARVRRVGQRRQLASRTFPRGGEQQGVVARQRPDVRSEGRPEFRSGRAGDPQGGYGTQLRPSPRLAVPFRSVIPDAPQAAEVGAPASPEREMTPQLAPKRNTGRVLGHMVWESRHCEDRGVLGAMLRGSPRSRWNRTSSWSSHAWGSGVDRESQCITPPLTHKSGLCYRARSFLLGARRVRAPHPHRIKALAHVGTSPVTSCAAPGLPS